MSLPAGTAYIQGFAVSPDGALYVTLAPGGGTITSMLIVKPPAGTAIEAGLTAQDIGTDWCGISIHQTQTQSARRSIGGSFVQIFSPLTAVASGQQYGVAVDALSYVGLDVAAAQGSQTYQECTGVSGQASVFCRVGKSVTVTVLQGLMAQTPVLDNTGGTVTIPANYGLRIRDQNVAFATTKAAIQVYKQNAIVSRNNADSADVNLLVTDTSDNVLVGHAAGLVTLQGYSTTMTGTLIENRATVTYSASMTPSAIGGNKQVITVTNAAAFTINAPTTPVSGMGVTYVIRNASGGALGVATWNGVFKMAAWTQPANGFSRSIVFEYDGANWVESVRGQTDIPN